MSSEPKRPIEELLKASAEARRAEFGADPQMPNPMRARLHEEIARGNRAAEMPARRGWLARFWPQLSVATAVAAALAIAAVVWMKPKTSDGNLQLAMSAPAQPPADAAGVLKSLPAAPPLAQAEMESKPLDEAVETDALTSGPAKSFDERSALLAMSRNEAAAAAAAPPVASAPGTTALANQAPSLANSARGQMLRNQAIPRNTAGVLNSFRVEQEGQQIRLVDADGSTYTGELEPRTNEARAKRAAPAGARAFASKPAPEPGVFFRASGFNARLQKRVVFEGNYIPLLPNEQKPAQSDGEKADASPAARIVGTAQVAGEAPVAVDAVAVSR